MNAAMVQFVQLPVQPILILGISMLVVFVVGSLDILANGGAIKGWDAELLYRLLHYSIAVSLILTFAWGLVWTWTYHE
jgi:hypothetical protein